MGAAVGGMPSGAGWQPHVGSRTDSVLDMQHAGSRSYLGSVGADGKHAQRHQHVRTGLRSCR